MPSGFHIRRIDESQPASRPPQRSGTRPDGTEKRGAAALFAALAPFRWIIARKRALGWKLFLLQASIWGCIALALYIGFLWATLPRVDEQTIFAAAQSTTITDRNGVELYRIHGEQDRTIIPASDIPDHLKHAVIAIEDKRYQERGCIDVRALLRAVLLLGRAGGASTITRQLARNALNLQRENIVSRKVKELILGCQLESRYSKPDLLALYLNWIPFGQNAYGAEQASRRYFGIGARDLTLAQSAILASLPQLPSYYSPYGRHVHTAVSESVRDKILQGVIRTAEDIPDAEVTIGLLGTMIGSGSTALTAGEFPAHGSGRSLYIGGRADQVLSSMQEQGLISEKDRQAATEALNVIAFKPVRENIRAPHFVLWTKEQVERMLKGASEEGLLEQGGLTIQTTLDWTLQEAAEAVIADHKEDLQKRFMADNVALVAIDPRTREVLAYVGNTDYTDATKEGKIDMAQIPRQPGSSFKPFVYTAAFMNGFSPSTILYDVPTTFGDYKPQNFEGSFWGVMSARRALGASRNIPAVKAYFLGGEEDTILAIAEAMGVPTPKATKPSAGYGASLAIGTAEVPLIEMVQGYATLAAGGKVRQLTSIRKVTDSRGALLTLPDSEAAPPSDETPPASPSGAVRGTQVIDPRVAYEVTSVLSDVSARPNEYWQTVLSVPGTQAAAKTGTSNKCLEREDRPGEDPETAPCKKRKPDNAWTIGYTPTLAVGVWVGNATSGPLSEKADGLTVAAPIWKDFMVKAQKILKPTATAFPVPDGIVQAQISLLSGELPTECTPVPLRKSDMFFAENAPTKDDPGCIQLTVDRVTGLLASDECPAEAREERSFLVPYNAGGTLFPQWDTDVATWAKELAKKQQTGSGNIALFASGSGGVLPLPLAPTEKCSLALTPGRTVKPLLQITAPAQGGTVNYPTFKPKLTYTVGSSVRQIEYAIDGKSVATAVGAPLIPTLRVPRSVAVEGLHTLRVTLTDEYYNIVSAESSFTFSPDRSGPDIRLSSPLQGLELPPGAPLVLRAESADPDGDIKYVEFFLDELLLARDATAPYELTYPGKIEPGPHAVRAAATDVAGNTGDDEVTITVR